MAKHALTAPTTKGDIDNVCKVVLDALEGVVFKNDNVVTTVLASKMWSVSTKGSCNIVVQQDSDYLRGGHVKDAANAVAFQAAFVE